MSNPNNGENQRYERVDPATLTEGNQQDLLG
jgi:hypothetical protein